MNHPFNDRGAHIRQEPHAADRPAARRHHHRVLVWLSVCLALMYVIATTVAAQTSRAPAEPPQTMTLAVSLLGGSSDEAADAGSSAFATTGPYADADVMLTYLRRVGRATFGLNGRSVVRGAQSTLTPMGQQVGFEFAFGGIRDQFRASQTLRYSPYYQFGVMADGAPTPLTEAAQSHGDFANADLTAMTSNTDVGWSRALSRRSALSASYNRRASTFDSPGLDMTAESVGGSLTRRITRDLSFRTGYTYQYADAASTVSRPPSIHALDVGVGYSRPLSFARRTTVSFRSGSSITPQEQGMAFHLAGDAELTKQIGRTWNARVGLNRSVQLLEGFGEPVLANTLNAAVGGGLQRRVSFSSSASYSSGDVGLSGGSGNGYANWRTGAGLSISVGRHGALDTQYFLAADQYDDGVVLPPGLSNGRRLRQGVRVGFRWHAALLGN